MYFNLMDAVGYGIAATDGEAGTVQDFYIDDDLWTVLHIAVADAGGVGTQFASVDPDKVDMVSVEKRTIGVNALKDEIAGGPDVSGDPPVSKQAHHRGYQRLRSLSEIQGYKVFSNAAEIGDLHGFIADDGHLKIHFVIIETGFWDGNRKVFVGPGLINQIDFDNKKVHVDLDRDGIKRSPEFDPEKPVLHVEDVKLVGRSGI